MWDEKFEKVIRKHLPFLSDGEELGPEMGLRDLGLDSMGTVEVLADLEAEYDVKFLDDALDMENFETPRKLWETLSRSRGVGVCPVTGLTA